MLKHMMISIDTEEIICETLTWTFLILKNPWQISNEREFLQPDKRH